MKPLRVVLHAHSTWSYDGKWSLPAIAKLYGACGVNAAMMTEHDQGFDPDSYEQYRAECAAASTSRCALIPGIEYSSPDNNIHILTWGLDHFLAEFRPVTETLQKVRDAGGVSIFAHPIRRDAWRKFDPAWVPLLSGIELWNRKSDGIMWGAEAQRLIAQTGLPVTVGQDFHKLRHLYPLTMKMTARRDHLEADLVDAIAQGTGIPCAFRAPLLGLDGAPKSAPHAQLEKLRCRVRDLVRR